MKKSIAQNINKKNLVQKINKKLTKGKLFNPWGLLKGIHVPITVLKSKGKLTNTAKLLLGILLHYGGKDGLAFPSRKRLAKDLDISLRTLDRAIKNLKDEELIYTYQKNDRSPSIYFFVNNSDYYKTNHINMDKIGGTDKNVSGGTDKNVKQKEINKERDNKRKRNLSTKDYEPAVRKPLDKNIDGSKVKKMNGKNNKSCKKVKVKLRIRKHKTLANGKDKIDEHKETQNLAPVKPLLRLPKIKIEPNPLLKFNFPQEVLEILNHWKNLGGKIPKDPNRRKIADTISNQIQELLIPGNNPYTPVLTDNELDQLRTKKWTVQEIKDSITHYKKALHKPIEQITFLQFILFRNYQKKDQKDFSPLILAYQALPQQLSFLAKKLKDDFTSDFPDVHIYDKTFINVATFLEAKLDQYKSYQPYSGIYFEDRFVNEIFFIYMTSKVKPKGTYEELKYMANPQNLREFILWCVDLNLIKSRTDEEMKKHQKITKQKYKNQIKSYQKEIKSGKAESKWTQEKWDYFHFMKEKVEC